MVDELARAFVRLHNRRVHWKAKINQQEGK